MSQASTIPFAQQQDFLLVAQALLPPGAAWPRDEDAQLTALLNASVASLTRLHARAAQLSETEAQPAKAQELLPAWEAAYGLPDPCTPLNPTVAQRQAAVAARIAAQGRGGQDDAYYIAIAAALGYVITITHFPAAKYGVSRYGVKPYFSEPWRFKWQVNVLNDAAFPAQYGKAKYGEPFVSYSGEQLSCVLNRIKPSYSVLLMNYEG